jgi:general secretion pathway protein E
LSAVLAQRLVRRLCDACRAPVPIPAAVRERFASSQDHWYEARGCLVCAQTGYAGRVGVYELLVVDDALRDAIGGGASSVALAQLARTNAYQPMFADGWTKVLAGDTTFAELERVVITSAAR